MSRFHSYLRTAAELVQAYSGAEPFASFLKKKFAAHKKFGSRDRREITQLCYSFFRLGKSAAALSLEEQFLVGLFLCSHQPQAVLQEMQPEWNTQIGLPINDKLQLLQGRIHPAKFFPFAEELSNDIDSVLFAQSHLVQPDLFIRIRPGYEAKVLQQLSREGIPGTEIFPGCLALANGTKLEQVLAVNREVVIQDAASQQLGQLLQSIPSTDPVTTVWDCCAASGGKSILVNDLLPNIRLTVSDVRESILRNLELRFKEAGISRYQAFIADLSRPWIAKDRQNESFDLIIADVPCSGSGTWGRTPEYLTHFDPSSLSHYTHLQQSILRQVLPYMRSKGYLLYSTCSVFKQENEEQVKWMEEELGLRIVQSSSIKGYQYRADTMYGALLQKA